MNTKTNEKKDEKEEELKKVEVPEVQDEEAVDDLSGIDATSSEVDGKEEVNWEEKYLRALADYQNLEKRSLEQRSEWIRSGNRELLLRILPVLDTLILAKVHSKDQSLSVSVQQFLDVLKAEGVTKIETVGQDFNPHIMEAVATEEGEEGKVTSEIQNGYMMHDKLLRPAMVRVGKAATTN